MAILSARARRPWRVLPFCAIAAFFGIVAHCTPARAWERHDILTRPMLSGEPWLSRYRSLLVEPASSDSDPYNPLYVPVYIDHLPGERESAVDILVRYVDEPAWGMDSSIQVSPWQSLEGGSRAFRQGYHYYAAGVVRLGDAPGRVAHFYALAVKDMKGGHAYWAFRNLARSLFYLEELGDPLNTGAFPYIWLWKTRLNSKHLQTLLANFSLDYDSFVQGHVERELSAGRGPLAEMLRKPPNLPFVDAHTAALALSEYSHGQAPGLFSSLEVLLPKRLQSMAKLVRPGPADLLPANHPESYYRVMQTTADCLRLTAGTVRGVMDLARRDFQPKAPKVAN